MLSISKEAGLAFLLLWSLLASTALLGQGSEPVPFNGALDYNAIKKDLAVFQGVIDTTVKQIIQGPFSILGSTKGTYLPEYGAVFNLEVNLYQIRQLSPFDFRPHTKKELDDAHDLMMKRIVTLKEGLVKAMGEYGSSLEQLKPNDYLTVVVHLFSGEAEAKRSAPSQMILRVKKSFITDYRENKLPPGDLAKKVELVQF
jgi:hypothetical protein